MKIRTKRWYKKQLKLAETQLDSRMIAIEALRQELRDANKEIEEKNKLIDNLTKR